MAKPLLDDDLWNLIEPILPLPRNPALQDEQNAGQHPGADPGVVAPDTSPGVAWAASAPGDGMRVGHKLLAISQGLARLLLTTLSCKNL